MKTKLNSENIWVYADWDGMEIPVLMGVLKVAHSKGKELFSFEYAEKWLEDRSRFQIDPELQLYSGLQYPGDEKRNFGIFLDSCPDRWGRILMQRRESAIAKLEQRPKQQLFERDYLLGVYDQQRLGALRFKKEKDGEFLSNEKIMAAPPWAALRELEEISLRLEEEEAQDNPEYLNWLSMLIAPGSSLGGASPKASIIDPDEHLWIAKFPGKNDHFNVGAWEYVVYCLAINAGINMSESQARKFTTRHHTFLTKRFDRTATGTRLHFASALTLLGYSDGVNNTDGVSYLELAEFISENGANVDTDLHQLFRRIVFNICVSNTDDHLRNHGFILSNSGWNLSPAYDINPNPFGRGLTLNITETSNELDLDLVMEIFPFFRLKETEAKSIINEVKSSVINWKKIAREVGVLRGEVEEMKGVFEKI